MNKDIFSRVLKQGLRAGRKVYAVVKTEHDSAPYTVIRGTVRSVRTETSYYKRRDGNLRSYTSPKEIVIRLSNGRLLWIDPYFTFLTGEGAANLCAYLNVDRGLV